MQEIKKAERGEVTPQLELHAFAEGQEPDSIQVLTVTVEDDDPGVEDVKLQVTWAAYGDVALTPRDLADIVQAAVAGQRVVYVPYNGTDDRYKSWYYQWERTTDQKPSAEPLMQYQRYVYTRFGIRPSIPHQPCCTTEHSTQSAERSTSLPAKSESMNGSSS